MIPLLLGPVAVVRAVVGWVGDVYREAGALWRVVLTPDPELGCLSNDEIDEMEER